jgi:mono/diheme cytochrome c family protein
MRSSVSAPSLILFALLVVWSAPARAGEGAELYGKQCASCHGDQGAADTALGRAMKVPSLNGGSLTVEVVRGALRGNAKHKAVASKVSDEDLDALTAHLATLGGPAPVD